MLQLFRCVVCLLVILVVFTMWGYGVGKCLGLQEVHLPLQVLCGFFSFFIVGQIIIIPMTFLHGSLNNTARILIAAVLVLSIYMLYKDRGGCLRAVKQMHIGIWSCATAFVLVGVILLAVRQQYMGYDTCYYVGQMNAFLQYGSFWTRDAFAGMAETSVIPLHYALSCFYPLWAVLAYLFHIEARLIAMYTIRSLCVILFACVAYTWGYKIFGNNTKKGYVFTILCLVLSMFSLSEHSSAFMMMVRGYESKGYCAAIVAPMCIYGLVNVFDDIDEKSNWKILALIAWASMPVAMSSMAIVPVAIAIAGIVLMLEHKQFWNIFWKCAVCVLPNMCLMAWYTLGK